MATAFDGVGMGMLGSEKRFMSQGKESPLAFLAGSLLMPKKEKAVELPPFSIGTLPSEQNAGAVPPPANASAEPVLPEAQNAPNAAIPDNAGESEDHPDTQRAMEDLGFTTPVVDPKPLTVGPLSAISPDLLKARNPAQDQISMEMASAPPPQMSLPQYGKQGGGGGDALKMLSSLATLFI